LDGSGCDTDVEFEAALLSVGAAAVNCAFEACCVVGDELRLSPWRVLLVVLTNLSLGGEEDMAALLPPSDTSLPLRDLTRRGEKFFF
jgi:hypothetical protein